MPMLRRVGVVLLLLVLFIGMLSACTAPGGFAATNGGDGIRVVATENFYGDIMQQLGGKHVSVTSLLSDPNVDPHQYESSVQNAIAVSNAQIVIENGGGYDSWMDRLLAASPNNQRVVLVATNIAQHKLPDNPHVWYGIDNIQNIAQAMTNALVKIDSKNTIEYDHNLQVFDQSLQVIIQKMNEIKARYAGTPVGMTETIYLYQALPMGLNVLTPFEFQKAIAEGNDPPADTVVTTTTQINQRQIKVLIYNEQTVTPITTNLENAAQQQHIPIVPVTETMPSGKNYQQWMLDQLENLESALQHA
jgi:zinc/manganese transport system substrate-binding protein